MQYYINYEKIFLFSLFSFNLKRNPSINFFVFDTPTNILYFRFVLKNVKTVKNYILLRNHKNKGQPKHELKSYGQINYKFIYIISLASLNPKSYVSFIIFFLHKGQNKILINILMIKHVY
ncbi:hypothetical protein EDEG_03468 [Edhazardia aedis USNM 41457]|uniref:Uncharacterized protein n=1 Tax=Edhazardia aedis (strain USNM 41457) TaxID=1003232 RepID=J8ZQY1_EDHAE|nr:hypothetical protein EDEG_03468 [Edhazardia aedis USNM 41457]|eukprot:EJW02083.1 hypothetical protein EDEG_03468 [Edhazardia aedis USNM 41457]